MSLTSFAKAGKLMPHDSIMLPKSCPQPISVCVCFSMWTCFFFFHMWLCWYVMQDTTVQLRFCQCKCEGKAKCLHLKTYVNQGGLAGTHVGKWTAVVKIVEIFQTKYPWSMVNWQLNPEVKKMASLSHWHEMPRLQRKTDSLAAYRGCF